MKKTKKTKKTSPVSDSAKLLADALAANERLKLQQLLWGSRDKMIAALRARRN